MANYSDLEPGLYLQRGTKMTRLDRAIVDLLDGGHDTTIEQLVESVAYVFIALNKREQKLEEIPYEWMVGDQQAEAPPFKFNADLFPQIDRSLQLYSVAYILKQRQGRRFLGLRWLDPTTIEPDDRYIDPLEGYTKYRRNNPVTGTWQHIDAADLIVIKTVTLRELGASPSAAMASSLAAQIIYGINVTADGYFDNNGLPVMLVKVPAGTGEVDKNRLEGFFRRIFNARGNISRREVRTVAVREGVEIQNISFAPKDLAMTDLERSKIDAILASHDVPRIVVFSDAANLATAQDSQRMFTGVMGSRLERIARAFNADPDIMATRTKLVVKVEQHWAMAQDEAQVSTAFVRYLNGMTPQAAGWLLGISEDDFPDEIKALGIWRDMTQQQPTFGDVIPDDTEDNDILDTAELKAAWEEEARRFKRWYKKRDDPDIAAFNSEVLTISDKMQIVEDMEDSAKTDAMTKAFFATLEQVNKALLSPEPAPQTFNIAPVINVPEREVNVAPATVEYKAGEIIVNVPETAVNVTMPEQPTPQVTVNVPEQAAAQVNVENVVNFPKTAKEYTEVKRDAQGRIASAKTTTEFDNE